MKASDVLLKELTDEELQSLPKEWIAVYIGRPRESDLSRPSETSRLRYAGILFLAFLVHLESGLNATSIALLSIIAMYEYAYSSQTKERALHTFVDARAEYEREVRALPDVPSRR